MRKHSPSRRGHDQSQPAGRLAESLESRTMFSAAGGDTDAAAAAATPLLLGQTVAGDISAPGEVDEYTFTAAAGQRIFLDVQKATGDRVTLYLDFMLYRLPPGQAPVRVFWTTAYANQPDIADRDVTTLEAGDYKLTVDTRQNDLAGYEFKIWDVPAADSRRINIGEEAAGAIEAPGNSDEYLFTAAPGQRIFLDVLETTGIFSSLYLDFTLVPVPQTTPPTQVFKSTAYATQPDVGDHGPVTLAGGEYRLIVDARGQDLSTYRFKLINVPPVDRNPTQFGISKSGAIESPGAADEWTFSVPAGDRAFLDVQEVTGNFATLYLDFSLQKIVGTGTQEKVKTTAFAGDADRADAGPVVLEPGDYKLVVSAREMDTATYRYVLRREMDVTAGATTWAAAFTQALRDAGLGDGGFRVYPVDPAKTLPWNNLNTLTARLRPGLTLGSTDVVARGVYSTRLASDFVYDPVSGLATVRFAAPLPYDNYAVDIGSEFRTRLRVLPGDGNREGRVNSLDLAFVKQRLNRSVQSPGTGTAAYSVFADMNGDARINALDLAAVKTNLNRAAPAALAAPAVGAGATESEEATSATAELLGED